MNYCIIVLLLTSIFSSSLFAQSKNKLEVTPRLNNGTILRKCETLELGKLLHKEKPVYPKEAKRSRVRGVVKVNVLVGQNGDVIQVIDATGHHLLKNAAIEAAKKTRFTPTICDGQVAQINALIKFNFIPSAISDIYFHPNKVEDFKDISVKSDYYESILILTDNYKLTFGYGDKNFHSNSPLTKGDFSHSLRLTLDFLYKRAELANKEPKTIGLFNSFNPQNINSVELINDFNRDSPFSDSLSILLKKYEITLVNNQKNFDGKLPLTQNEVIDYWVKIFGEDAVPIHFRKIKIGDKILSRGEFSLFLHESLYVLTYKVLP